jgi:class 3 adenylate cyclase
MSDFVGEAVAQRVQDDEASRLRALGAAIVIGFGAAVVAYRLLRNSGGGNSD